MTGLFDEWLRHRHCCTVPDSRQTTTADCKQRQELIRGKRLILNVHINLVQYIWDGGRLGGGGGVCRISLQVTEGSKES